LLNRSRNRLEDRDALRRLSSLVLLAGVTLISASCGYHVAGRSSKLPTDWSSIAIPAFKNDTTRYRLEQRLTEAVIHEFLTRTKYRVIQNEEDADGVLHGEVLSIETAPVIFNSTTGEVELMLVTVHAKVLLVDRKTSNPVYTNNDMVFRDEYQISSDVQSFFDEQSPALGRMSRDFASKLVANVVENF
jgi:outer membrane lipopolysaccharide assembly protein LptE/RlpB